MAAKGRSRRAVKSAKEKRETAELWISPNLMRILKGPSDKPLPFRYFSDLGGSVIEVAEGGTALGKRDGAANTDGANNQPRVPRKVNGRPSLQVPKQAKRKLPKPPTALPPKRTQPMAKLPKPPRTPALPKPPSALPMAKPPKRGV